jgi:cytochrome c oxidase assembly protein subunit 15
VGLLAIATVVATFAADRRRLPRVLSVAALLAVIAQGAIGGFRVLERSENLAFLHGAIAQGVFALLGASWIALSTVLPVGAIASTPESVAFGRNLRRLSIAAVASVYLQIVAGAWLRHGGGTDALALHLVVALPVVILVPLLAREMRSAGDRAGETARRGFQTARRWLIGAITGQILLGIGALVVVSMPAGARAEGGLGTAVLPTLHVVGGGLLLLSCVGSAMMASRVFPARAARPLPTGAPGLPATVREQWGAVR